MNLLCLVTLIALCSVASAQYYQPMTSLIDFANTTGTVYAVAFTRSGIFIGGAFSFSTPSSGTARNLFAIMNNGSIKTWGTGPDNTVYALHVDFPCSVAQRQLMVGGAFITINGIKSRRFILIDLNDFSWGEFLGTYFASGSVRTIGMNGLYSNDVLAGGNFQLSLTSYNCTLARYVSADQKWYCVLNSTAFNQVNAISVSHQAKAVIAVGDPSYKIAISFDRGVSFTFSNQSGTSGSSYAIGYYYDNVGPLFVGGDGFLNKFTNLSNIAGSQSSVTSITGSVFSTYVTGYIKYRPDTLWFSGNFTADNSYPRPPLSSNGLQAYSLISNDFSVDELSLSWFPLSGTAIRDIDFSNYENPQSFCAGGTFSRAGAVVNTKNIVVQSFNPPTKSDIPVCLATPGIDLDLISSLTWTLQKGFNSISFRNITSNLVNSDFDGCNATLLVLEPSNLINGTSLGNVMLAKIQQGMRVVLTETLIEHEMKPWGTSTFVNDAMCSKLGTGLNAVTFDSGSIVVSPLMNGIEYFGNNWAAITNFISSPNNTLYATQAWGKLGVCTRAIPNSVGGNTTVVQLNFHPQPGWVNGNYEQLVIQALKF